MGKVSSQKTFHVYRRKSFGDFWTSLSRFQSQITSLRLTEKASESNAPVCANLSTIPSKKMLSFFTNRRKSRSTTSCTLTRPKFRFMLLSIRCSRKFYVRINAKESSLCMIASPASRFRTATAPSWRMRWRPGLFLFIFALFTFQFKWQIFNLNNINLKSVDAVLGTQTCGGRMDGADEPTELWRHPYVTTLFNPL